MTRRLHTFWNGLRAWFSLLLMGAGFLAACSGVVIIIISVVAWLYSSRWSHWGNDWLLEWSPSLFGWIYQPKEWLGLAAIARWCFDWLPLWLLTVPAGIMLVVSGATIDEARTTSVVAGSQAGPAPAATSHPRT